MRTDSAKWVGITDGPAFPAMGAFEEQRPRLHERQIEEIERWHQQRLARIEAHARRVALHLRQFSRRKHRDPHPQGKRRSVWCVELRRKFESLSAAGRFVDRPASNIFHAIRNHKRCGGYRWDYFDPAQHTVAVVDSPAEQSCQTVVKITA